MTMVVANDSFLGIGLYTVQEAALYARVPVQTMSRWLYGSKGGEPVLTPELAGREEKFVTFLDFIQAIHVRHIRKTLGVPLARIRRGIEIARDTYALNYRLLGSIRRIFSTGRSSSSCTMRNLFRQAANTPEIH